MKKCPYCGKEYPDDVKRCLTDNEILLGGKTPMPEAEQNAVTVLPSLSPQKFLTTPRTALWTDRQLLIMEVVLVCAIAFGGNILASFHTFFSSYPDSSSGDTTSYKWIYAIFRQGSVLGVLWYILIRRGKSFADFGLAWAPKDFGWSIILRVGGSLAFYAVYDAIYSSGLTAVSHKASVAHVDHFLFGSSVSIMAILFQFLNPFFEELIARAYVMTTVKYLRKR
jgi:membrane protease YdiL (CAAX protease family)